MNYKTEEYKKNMSLIDYVNDRLIYNINRYHSKASFCRKMYLFTTYFAIILTSLVPILINLEQNHPLFTTAISFLVIILISIENVFHYRERWKNYDLAEELLRREKYFFQTGAEKYKGLKNNKSYYKLVDSTEEIIKEERDGTLRVRTKKIETK